MDLGDSRRPGTRVSGTADSHLCRRVRRRRDCTSNILGWGLLKPVQDILVAMQSGWLGARVVSVAAVVSGRLVRRLVGGLVVDAVLVGVLVAAGCGGQG